jgi:predicted transcriptional regulator
MIHCKKNRERYSLTDEGAHWIAAGIAITILCA